MKQKKQNRRQKTRSKKLSFKANSQAKFQKYHLLVNVLLFLFLFLLPTQLGKHFFFPFSYIFGVRVDYLAPTLFLTDIISTFIIALHWRSLKPLFSRNGLLILAGALVNIFFSRSPFVSVIFALRILQCAGVFLVIRDLFDAHKKYVFGGLAAGLLLESVLVFLQFFHKGSIQGLWYFLGERAISLSTPGAAKVTFTGTELLRPYGTFSHPNSMGGFFLLVAIVFLTNPFVTNLIMKYSVIALASCLVLFSFSKATLAVLLVISTLYYFRNLKTCRICFAAKILPLILLSFIFFQGRTDPTSLSKRLDLIGNAAHIILSHPFSGTGLGAYLTAQALFPMRYTYFFLQPVHNIFLLWIAETGIVGTVGLMGLIKKVAASIYRPPVLYPLLVVLLTGMVDHYWLTLQQNRLLLAVAFGISFGSISGIMKKEHVTPARSQTKK